MEKILIVDDDTDIQRLVSYNLQLAGFQPQVAGTGRSALEMIASKPPELIILDLMLPDIDGNEVCRTLRQNEETRRIPILMLSARSEEIDRVLGFELGADDYVTKPFSPRELVLRVKSILRRGKAEQTSTLQAGALKLEAGKRQCYVDGTPVVLTPKEFDLLSELMKAAGNVLTRQELLEGIWGYHGDATSRTLDTHIRRLREKLGSEAHRLETVRGIGFRVAT